MGIVYRKQNQYQDALDSYQHAVRLKPDYADAYNAMGNVYDDQNQYQDALDSYQHVLRLKPDCADAYNAMGIVYRQAKSVSGCTGQLSTCLETQT